MRKNRILVVDDEHANQFLLDGILTSNGYEVIIATDGEECLKRLETEEVGLILLDIMMPRMSGIQVLKKIIEHPVWNIIPVIMVSAKTGAADIREALEIGAIDYIKKPFEETELLARVKVGIRLKEKEDNLREMIYQREEFIGIISHDLRSPFIAIHGFAEIILDDVNLTEKQKETLKKIIESVNFSQDYFNKLLSWAKLEKGDIELNTSVISLDRLVNSCFQFQQTKADKKNITLINALGPEDTILADEVFFRQVIENLVSNAIKFTNHGGRVKCFVKQSGKTLQLVVSDNGIGMPENYSKETSFSGLFLQSRRGTMNEKGTGIGLSICTKITDAHGFGISFTENAEGGTDFVIAITQEEAESISKEGSGATGRSAMK